MITSDAGEECRIRSRVPMVAEYHLSITRVQQHHALLSVLRHATETEYCLSTPDFLLLDKVCDHYLRNISKDLTILILTII